MRESFPVWIQAGAKDGRDAMVEALERQKQDDQYETYDDLSDGKEQSVRRRDRSSSQGTRGSTFDLPVDILVDDVVP